MLLLSAFNPVVPVAQDEQQAFARITQVDTSQFPQVTLYVSVVDAAGQPLVVNPSRLQISENGEIISLAQIEGFGEVGALTTLLVMDVSGSMNTAGKLEAAKAAAQLYIDQMRPEDQAGLLAFNTQIEYVQPVTPNTELLSAAVDRLTAREDTAMYDALAEGVDVLDDLEGRKAIIVLTDGLDNRSSAAVEEVIERIGPAGLSISTVGLGEPGQSTAAITALDEVALRYLADNAGGLYGYAEDEESLLALYQGYALTMQSEYVLTYTSPSQLRDGVNRALSVTLAGAAESAAAPEGGQTVYNPGGLVPEVAEPAPWTLFLTLLAVLFLLLLVPGLIGRAASVTQKTSGRLRRKSSRIKLRD
jgi:VWFA-related protein